MTDWIDGIPGDGVPAPLIRAMASRFPGELALRDTKNVSIQQAQVCAARFAVLQLIERHVAGELDPAWWAIELEAAAAYIGPLNQKAPREAARLRRVVDRMNRDDGRGVPAALLAAGDTAIAAGHLHGAWGLFSAAFELAEPMGRNAIALSAASRLTELATLLRRPRLASRWERRCGRLLASCQ